MLTVNSLVELRTQLRNTIILVAMLLTPLTIARAAAPPTTAPAPVGGVYDVKAFGATGDGKTLDSPAINRAIEAATAAGGGTVRFPAGNFLCTSIHLASDIILEIGAGATIIAAAPQDGFNCDPPEPNPFEMYQDFGHGHWHNSLIWGENLHNVSIVGPGTIWGKGLARNHKRPEDGADKSIALKLCRNVLIRDVVIMHGGHMAILATGVEDLTVDNVKIDTNRDGIDIDCCRNVRISNCCINSPLDDGLCLKSSYALGDARPTENVTISNCHVSGFDEGSFLNGTFERGVAEKYGKGPTGRIKFGTESNGGLRALTISNCVFEYCGGLSLTSVDGGTIEDVTITNITMRDIINAPIFLRLGARLRGPQQSTHVGALRRVTITNVTVNNADPRTGSIISGIPGHDIEDVKLSNIRICYRGGGTKEEAATQPTERENGYPEPGLFGQIPAYGFYIRHAGGIEVSGVKVTWEKDDLRPAFALDDVAGACFDHVIASHLDKVPTFVLKRVTGFRVDHCDGVPETSRDAVVEDSL